MALCQQHTELLYAATVTRYFVYAAISPLPQQPPTVTLPCHLRYIALHSYRHARRSDIIDISASLRLRYASAAIAATPAYASYAPPLLRLFFMLDAVTSDICYVIDAAAENGNVE